MKVLSYLEMILFLNSDNDKKEQFELIKIMEHFGFSGIAPFYSQPFKPELIPELFDGWIKYEIDSLGHIESVFRKKGEYQICFSSGTMFTRKIDDYCDKYSFFPRTLDEFITDCQRAGVELIWRIK